MAYSLHRTKLIQLIFIYRQFFMEMLDSNNISPGTVLFGRFKVLRCVGRGSVGTVFACETMAQPSQLVALKVLSARAARDERMATAFRKEIHASYRVSHSNVVRCYEFFRDRGSMAISMEYVEGVSLGDIVKNSRVLSAAATTDILRQLCQGVTAIHDAGIVHQDLKPHNILITPRGKVKITDFTAAHLRYSTSSDSQTGIFGTMEFLSPETILTGQVDQRSDIFALGVIGYLMITGRLPFPGHNITSEMNSKLNGSPIPPRVLNPDCPELLNRVILQAIARDPLVRFQRADEMLSAFARKEPLAHSGIFERFFAFTGLQRKD